MMETTTQQRAQNDALLVKILELHDKFEDIRRDIRSRRAGWDEQRVLAGIDQAFERFTERTLRRVAESEGVTAAPNADAKQLAKALLETRVGRAQEPARIRA